MAFAIKVEALLLVTNALPVKLFIACAFAIWEVPAWDCSLPVLVAVNKAFGKKASTSLFSRLKPSDGVFTVVFAPT